MLTIKLDLNGNKIIIIIEIYIQSIQFPTPFSKFSFPSTFSSSTNIPQEELTWQFFSASPFFSHYPLFQHGSFVWAEILQDKAAQLYSLWSQKISTSSSMGSSASCTVVVYSSMADAMLDVYSMVDIYSSLFSLLFLIYLFFFSFHPVISELYQICFHRSTTNFVDGLSFDQLSTVWTVVFDIVQTLTSSQIQLLQPCHYYLATYIHYICVPSLSTIFQQGVCCLPVQPV